MLEEISYFIRRQREIFINEFSLMLRRVAIKMLLVLSSIPFLFFGIFMFLLAIFFSLSNLNCYIFGSIITGIISLVISVVLLFLGLKTTK